MTIKIKAISCALFFLIASIAQAQPTSAVQPAANQSSFVFDGFVVVKALLDSEKNGSYKTCPTSSELVFIGKKSLLGPDDSFACQKEDGSNNKSILVAKTVDRLLEESLGTGVRAVGVLPVSRYGYASGMSYEKGQIMILYKKN